MKNIFEKILDLIYDYLDYIVMLAIVLIVVGIIGWRLDIIFTSDTAISKNPPTENVDDNNEDENENPINTDEIDEIDETNEGEENLEDDQVDDVSEEDQETPDDPESEDSIEVEVGIEIPSGTMPHEIASMLLESKLITNTSSFLERAQELNVITRLKAGDYMFPSNCSIDEILEILSK